MADSVDSPEIFWVDPELRGIIPLEQFHVSRSLRKKLAKTSFDFSVNACFDDVMQACSARNETWINPEIRALYNELNSMGYAHSVEVWHNGNLYGGLYGVCIGGAFFGESMFSKGTDGSKIALISLIARLKFGGFSLLDTQFLTPHLKTMGGVEITQDHYKKLLDYGINLTADFQAMPLETPVHELLQLSTQTS